MSEKIDSLSKWCLKIQALLQSPEQQGVLALPRYLLYTALQWKSRPNMCILSYLPAGAACMHGSRHAFKAEWQLALCVWCTNRPLGLQPRIKGVNRSAMCATCGLRLILVEQVAQPRPSFARNFSGLCVNTYVSSVFVELIDIEECTGIDSCSIRCGQSVTLMAPLCGYHTEMLECDVF